MVLMHRKLYFSKDQEGVRHFSGEGGPTFSRRGVQMLISIKKLVIFQGVRTPLTPSESVHEHNIVVHVPILECAKYFLFFQPSHVGFTQKNRLTELDRLV